MATLKPRVTVMLEFDDYHALKRLSVVNGESLSAIISSLVVAARPVLDRLVELANTFAEASAAQQGDILALLEDAEKRVVPEAEAVADELLSALTPPTSNRRVL